MNVADFENIIKSDLLKTKVENILKNITDRKSAYIACVTLLEFINVKLLKEYFKFEFPDYNIIRIIELYAKADENLFNFMLGVNAEYNMINMNEIEESDIENLLYDIDFLYGYIVEKYGKLID